MARRTGRNRGNAALLAKGLRLKVHIADTGIGLDEGAIEIETPGCFGKGLRCGRTIAGSEIFLQC
ncbi:hypothetical protein D3C86_1895420 [compost metagenome]